jgi:hypothetical protein
MSCFPELGSNSTPLILAFQVARIAGADLDDRS